MHKNVSKYVAMYSAEFVRLSQGMVLEAVDSVLEVKYLLGAPWTRAFYSVIR